MVSIIILTYNSSAYIKKLIESIYEFNKKEDFEIIVVDNASTDDTAKKVSSIKHKVSGIKLIQNQENAGFAAGINIGARESKGDYLLFINPDAEWKSGSISGLIECLNSNINIGIVGGKLVNKKGEAEKSCGKFFGLLASSAIALGLDNKLGIRFSPKKEERVDFVSGGFMFIKNSLFIKLDGFDEHYFMYVEDMDLCFRARFSGYITYFTPNVAIEHVSHGSSNRGFAIKNIYKGIFYFHKAHGTPFSYMVVKSLFSLKAILLVLVGKIMNNKYLSTTYSNALKG
ncbi:MAG TPA: glycosyltransferase family 2 protein [Patescibacteria group bacterium]|nr:glycosyltransferase family 2 protein [Patescibacteria group bacterium]